MDGLSKAKKLGSFFHVWRLKIKSKRLLNPMFHFGIQSFTYGLNYMFSGFKENNKDGSCSLNSHSGGCYQNIIPGEDNDAEKMLIFPSMTPLCLLWSIKFLSI